MPNFDPISSPPPNFLSQYALLGHRGARAEILENSQIGFQYAQELVYKNYRLDGVEFDVQLTADHQLVVVHDESLARLGQQQGLIYQMSLSDIQQMRQADWIKFCQTNNVDFLHQPIMTLAQILPYLQGYRHIELEVKTHKATHYPTLAKAVFDTLKHPVWQTLPIKITSFDTEFLSTWQNYFQSKLPFNTGLLLDSNATLASEIAFLPNNSHQVTLPVNAPVNVQVTIQITAVCNLACRLGCGQIGVYFTLITPELIAIAHRYGLQVTAWTVNDISVAKQLLAWQIDTLITDFPTLFLKALHELSLNSL